MRRTTRVVSGRARAAWRSCSNSGAAVPIAGGLAQPVVAIVCSRAGWCGFLGSCSTSVALSHPAHGGLCASSKGFGGRLGFGRKQKHGGGKGKGKGKGGGGWGAPQQPPPGGGGGAGGPADKLCGTVHYSQELRLSTADFARETSWTVRLSNFSTLVE